MLARRIRGLGWGALPLALLLILSSAEPARTQQPPSQGDSSSSSSSSSSSGANDDSSSSSSSSSAKTDASGKKDTSVIDPKYNPLPAEQDVEVGQFYMHKGDVDAAIARYQHAIEERANFAKPRLLLGEAYEKKGDKSAAVKYYKEYLQVYPSAPDKSKVEKKIAKLSD